MTQQYERCAVPVPHRYHRLLWISQIDTDITDGVDYTDILTLIDYPDNAFFHVY